MASSLSAHAIDIGDLVHFVSMSHFTTAYPSYDAIVAVLNTRFRSDLTYSRIGTTDPTRPSQTFTTSVRENMKNAATRTSASRSLAPLSFYELAAQVYLLMRRTRQSQSVITRGITGSGKSFSLRFLVDQFLRLPTARS
ncbi:hypothetical protein JVT61DRAFT_12386 [Boletus reticuloceps]|uniref:Uncharacterized protein n=1 Tax=Boletus reticuloceps TaxID=495285 RepID=A0A8I3A3N9_9AGAM|nr:hypothetical protein JVT61DRAFT_12386 [Boletus reticuloceps]